MFLGSRCGGMLAVPITLLLIRQWGWRWSFVTVGSVGIVWAAAWYWRYRDRPADHPGMSPTELAWIEQDAVRVSARVDTPWRALLTNRNLYTICVMYFAFGYGLYFYFTWLPTFLIRELHFSLLAGGIFAALPFLLAGSPMSSAAGRPIGSLPVEACESPDAVWAAARLRRAPRF